MPSFPDSCRPTSARSSVSDADRSVAALSESRGHPQDRRAILELFPEDESLRRWITMARTGSPIGDSLPDLLARAW